MLGRRSQVPFREYRRPLLHYVCELLSSRTQILTLPFNVSCLLSHFSRVRLCDPMDCSPPGSSVHGILQARTLEWVAISSSKGSSQPRDLTNVSYISCIGRQLPYR